MSGVSIIVTAADVAAANLAARYIDPESGCEDSITVPLSPSGTLPATHFGTFFYPIEGTLAEVLNMQAEFAGSTVAQADFFQTITGLGLQVVQDENE